MTPFVSARWACGDVVVRRFLVLKARRPPAANAGVPAAYFESCPSGAAGGLRGVSPRGRSRRMASFAEDPADRTRIEQCVSKNKPKEMPFAFYELGKARYYEDDFDGAIEVWTKSSS